MSDKPAEPAAPDAEKNKGGRPRAKLPEDLLARIGPPPADPIQAGRWVSRLMLELLWLEARGEAPAKLAERLKSIAGAAIRALPAEAAAELDRRLRAGDEEGKAETAGPTPEPVTQGGKSGAALRG